MVLTICGSVLYILKVQTESWSNFVNLLVRRSDVEGLELNGFNSEVLQNLLIDQQCLATGCFIYFSKVDSLIT